MMEIIFYIAIFFIIFIMNIIGEKYYNNKNMLLGKIIIAMAYIILLSLLGFRYEVGTDYQSYLKYYNTIELLSWSELFSFDWEYGALLLFKLTSVFFKNDYIIFFLIGVLTLYPIYKMNKIYDYKYLPYSILIFCFVFLPFCMNGMRQGIAMGFVMLSFIYLYNNDKKNFIINIIIAFLFHKSALLFLPYSILYLIIKNEKYTKYSILLTLFISIIILFFLKDFLINDFDNYSYMIENINSKNVSYKTIILYIPVLLIIYLLRKKGNFINIISSLFLDGIILDIVGTSARFLSRISYYFTIFEILLIPNLIQNINNKETRLVIKILFIIYLIIYFIYCFYICGKQEIFPYKSWLFEI